MSRRAAAIRVEDHFEAESLPPIRATAAEAQPRIRHAEEGDRPAPSLPIELQREVAQAFAQGAFDADGAAQPSVAKWSPRRTLAFMFLTCSAFWIAFAWLMVKLF